jgi:glycosyltransferase involved in cell wall biosynthesis
VAELLGDVVITALPGSYPRSGPKIRPIGHAVDTGQFRWSPVRRAPETPLRLVAAGRLSPVKGYDTMIRAVARARDDGVDVTLRIVGSPTTPLEVQHRRELVELARRSPDGVQLQDAVPREQVGRVFEEADVLVNATAGGSADKVVFEAMAAGRPVLVSSTAFTSLLADADLPLVFGEGDVGSLALRIASVAGSSSEVLTSVGRGLHEKVEREHSLRHWARAVARLVSELQERRIARSSSV